MHPTRVQSGSGGTPAARFGGLLDLANEASTILPVLPAGVKDPRQRSTWNARPSKGDASRSRGVRAEDGSHSRAEIVELTAPCPPAGRGAPRRPTRHSIVADRRRVSTEGGKEPGPKIRADRRTCRRRSVSREWARSIAQPERDERPSFPTPASGRRSPRRRTNLLPMARQCGHEAPASSHRHRTRRGRRSSGTLLAPQCCRVSSAGEGRQWRAVLGSSAAAARTGPGVGCRKRDPQPGHGVPRRGCLDRVRSRRIGFRPTPVREVRFDVTMPAGPRRVTFTRRHCCQYHRRASCRPTATSRRPRRPAGER